MTRLYFAHPISLYNTPAEADMVRFMAAALKAEIVNPSAPEHQEAVERIRASHGADREAGSAAIMDYFVAICSNCDAVVFAPFPGGALGAGVVREVESFLSRGKTAYEIADNGQGSWNLKAAASLDAYSKLSPQETRAMLSRLKTPGYTA